MSIFGSTSEKRQNTNWRAFEGGLMPTKKSTEKTYTKKEAQQRFEAALRGSRVIGPTPMSDMANKQELKQKKRGK